MCPIALQPLFTYFIGLLIIGGGLMLSQGVAAASRKQAAVTILTSSLLALLASFIEHNYIFSNIPQNAPLPMLLPVIASIALALPLLDRTRHTGLIFASAFGGLVLVHLIYDYLPPHLPTGLRLGLPRLLLLASSLAAIIGSLRLALHPARHMANGDARWMAVPSGLLLTGWLCFGTGIMLLTTNIMGNIATIVPMGVSALTAALVALLVTDPTRDSLHKTGEALVAGMLMVIAQPVSFELCLLLGFVAGFLVVRSEAIALSLRVDDPLHLIGAILLPSFFGILLQGILFDIATLASILKWLAGGVLVSVIVAFILWPLTAFLFGFAAKLRPLPAKKARKK